MAFVSDQRPDLTLSTDKQLIHFIGTLRHIDVIPLRNGICNPQSTRTVSYTHLDVYKRQERPSLVRPAFILLVVSISGFFPIIYRSNSYVSVYSK